MFPEGLEVFTVHFISLQVELKPLPVLPGNELSKKSDFSTLEY